MKLTKKFFAIVAIMCVLFIITGCTPSSDEAQIESVVKGYTSAISNQNWNKARSYCLEGSIYYDTIDQFEDLFNQPGATGFSIEYNVTISNISINNSHATVNGAYSTVVSAGSLSQSDSGNATMSLQKVNGSWKLY